MGNGFWGGVFQGGMAVLDQNNKDRQVAMMEKRDARDQQAFDDAQSVKEAMKDIGTQEAAAVDLNKQAPAAIDDSVAEATKNISADESMSPEDKASQIAASAAGIKSAWGARGGVVPDDVNAYRFGLQRVNALKASGALKEAREMHKDVTDAAVGSFIGALGSGDSNKAFQMYQTFPNGHYVQSLTVSPDGKTVLSIDSTGHRIEQPTSKLIATALGYTSPEKAATILASMEGREDAQETRRSNADLAAAIRLMTARGSGSGGGSGGTGTGGGHSGAGGFPMGEQQAKMVAQYGWKDPASMREDVQKYVLGGEKGDGVIGDPNAPKTAALIRSTQSYTDMLSRSQLSTNTSSQQIMDMAYGMAQRESGKKFSGEAEVDAAGKLTPAAVTMATAFKPYGEIGSDGKWYAKVHDAKGNVMQLTLTPVDPTSLGMKPAQVTAAEAERIKPMLLKAADSPEDMKLLVGKFGESRVQAMLAVIKPQTPAAAMPSPAAVAAKPAAAITIPAGMPFSQRQDVSIKVAQALKGDAELADLDNKRAQALRAGKSVDANQYIQQYNALKAQKTAALQAKYIADSQ